MSFQKKGKGIIMPARYWLKGEYTHTIDPKGRTYLPARFRDVLGDNVVIGLGLSCDHMVIYTLERYDEIARNIDDIANQAEEGVEELRDFFYNNSYDVELDKSGRLTLPTNLRNMFDLSDEIIITGDGDKAKIWKKETYFDRKTTGRGVDIQKIAEQYKIFARKDDDNV